MESGTSTWDHVDPFEEDRNARDQHNASENIPPEECEPNRVTFQTPDQDGSGNVDEKLEARQAPAERSSSSEDTVQSKAERSSSHDEGVTEKVKTAAHEAKYSLLNMRSAAPLKRFNPTNVRMHVRYSGSKDHDTPAADSAEPTSRSQSEFNVLWRSRDNRKGRGSIAVPRVPELEPSESHIHIGSTIKSTKQIGKGILKMTRTFPYWNLAFWSGWWYAWGSALFIISATWSWYPQEYPDEEYNEGLVNWGVSLTTFFGVLLFQLGATAAYLEAVNDGSFHGTAMRRLLEGHEDEDKKLADEKIHQAFSHAIPHFHRSKKAQEAEAFANSVDPEAGWRTRDIRERPGSIYPVGKLPAPRRGGFDLGDAGEGASSEYMTWRWWPTWHALRTHHAYEIGYLACSIQGFGVTLFTWSGIVLLPGVWGNIGGRWGQLGAYWVPQIIASACFITASVMFTIETQEKWWKPQPNILGWWIGFVATLGSVGFELCAVFGVPGESWTAYQSSLSSMWGSIFFLLSSLLQWYEAINKHPVAEVLNEPGEMKSYQVHPI
ncbi:uncharacterized protein LTR77_004380 [Saxophila tyrrhenica]|uniref:Integral membrane protein n=1 Tax=Saxophila tyrrhenica TaxID=1690608 RepID=A0AAV9PCM4_9PEZI|nr:hypothetical protein LTR77_004380 [Saxophila tyrrhenica]